jgi:hypothetical protein
MPPDVNEDSASSAEDQRIESESLADDTANLSPEHEAYLKNPRMAEALKTLTGGGTKDDTSSEGAKQDQPDNQTEDEKTDQTTGQESESSEDEAATADEDSEPGVAAERAPAAKATAKAGTDADDEDDSYPDEAETAAFSPNAQRRIRQLVAQRKRAESQLAEALEDAQYRRGLKTTLKNVGITPEAFDEWTQLGIVVQTDPAAAAKVLGRLAETLGYTPAKAEPDRLDDDLKALVDDDQMTEAAAKRIQATRKQPSRAADPTQQPRTAVAPAEVPSLVKKPESGAQIMARLDAEFATKFGTDWEGLAKEVNAELANYRGTPLHLWERTIRDAVARVAQRKPSTVSKTPDPVSRGSGGRSVVAKPGNKPPTRESIVSNLSFVKGR